MAAEFSDCGLYRYSLTRSWGDGPHVTWIMLNPSTADHRHDDPTIRRCIGFAKAWGYDGIYVGNAFALRSTDPKALYSATDPIGPRNDLWLVNLAKAGALTIAAWGVYGEFMERGHRVHRMALREGAGQFHCLGLTAAGHPRHPLYVRGDTLPQLFPVREAA